MTTTKRSGALVFVFLLASISKSAIAQSSYPNHPIAAIVPFAPGSAVEIIARAIATPLAKELGQPIVITTKPGADGMLGMNALANSKADGYTILFTAGAATIGPALHRQIGYDPIAQIAPVAEVGTSPYVVAINAKLPAKDLADLAKLAKGSERGLNAASAGNGTRLSVEMFALQTKSKIQVINFDGTAQAVTAIMAGDCDLVIMDSLALVAPARTGLVRVLAVAADQQISEMPNVPTSSASGLPGYTAGSTFGVYTVGGTPPEFISRLNEAINKVIEMPDVIKTLKPLGLEISQGRKTSDDFKTHYLNELNRWKNVVEEAHIPMAD